MPHREHHSTPPHDAIEQLRSRFASLYPLRSFDVPILGRSYTLTTAHDIEALIEEITDEEFRRDERLPYWADLWHSAVALSTYLAEHPSFVRNLDVLELGCGLGLPGIVAGGLGARMTMSDFDETALLAAELNFRTNHPRVGVRILHLDFRTPPSETWARIIAADIIYERRFITPLIDCIDQCLARGGTLLLAEPNRQVAEEFFAKLHRRGFHDEHDTVSASLYGRAVEISIHAITRSADAAAGSPHHDPRAPRQ